MINLKSVFLPLIIAAILLSCRKGSDPSLDEPVEGGEPHVRRVLGIMDPLRRRMGHQDVESPAVAQRVRPVL